MMCPIAKKSILQLLRERPFWLGTIVATFLINLIYNKRFTDVIGTKLIRTDVIKSLGCKADNQAFEFELVSRLCKNGYKIEEIILPENIQKISATKIRKNMRKKKKLK